MRRSVPSAHGRRASASLRALALTSMLAACTLVVDPRAGAGIGATCNVADQCQASECVDGLCTVRCASTAACPGGTVCAGGTCNLGRIVTLVGAYDLQQDEVGQAAQRGLDETAEALGYVAVDEVAGFEVASETFDQLSDRLVEVPADVVVVATPFLANSAAESANAHPDATYLIRELARASANGNRVSFDARSYQAYFLAGYAAGRLTTTDRLGFIASVATPSMIASVNAFMLGARLSGGGAVVTELRWIGTPHDLGPKVDGKSKERRDTEALVAAGADVIAHNVDSNIPAFTVRDLIEDTGVDVYAVGVYEESACDILPAGACAGSVVYNWTPLFTSIIDGLHRGIAPPSYILEPIRTSNDASVVYFQVGEGLSGGSTLTSEIENLRTELASDGGVGRIFDGPLVSTGQCEAATGLPECVPAGMRLSDEGLETMCWLVSGIVDEAGMPAMVPDSAACPSPE